MTRHDAYYAALEADNAWHAELVMMFGDDAGDARYDARGKSTPQLHTLWKAFRAANDKLFAVERDLTRKYGGRAAAGLPAEPQAFSLESFASGF